MNTRAPRHVAILLPAALLAACAAYVPPAPPPAQSFSRDLPASFDRAWSAAARVADEGFLHAATVEKADGAIATGFWTRDPAPYVDCGGAGGLGLGFDAAFLEATANIAVRPDGGDKAEVQVNDRYRLGVYRIDPIGNRILIAEFRFDSGSEDTRRIGLRFVTCRSSFRFEREFLDQVAARI